ncbi:MAG: hypothetical protein KGK08_14125 [Acidobacteriota bacterium]|nr:hypothetical protein [Acidobacteriota bacterium]
MGLVLAILWAADPFAWWKLSAVAFMLLLVAMQVQRVRRQNQRDQALRQQRREAPDA